MFRRLDVLGLLVLQTVAMVVAPVYSRNNNERNDSALLMTVDNQSQPFPLDDGYVAAQELNDSFTSKKTQGVNPFNFSNWRLNDTRNGKAIVISSDAEADLEASSASPPKASSSAQPQQTATSNTAATPAPTSSAQPQHTGPLSTPSAPLTAPPMQGAIVPAGPTLPTTKQIVVVNQPPTQATPSSTSLSSDLLPQILEQLQQQQKLITSAPVAARQPNIIAPTPPPSPISIINNPYAPVPTTLAPPTANDIGSKIVSVLRAEPDSGSSKKAINHQSQKPIESNDDWDPDRYLRVTNKPTNTSKKMPGKKKPKVKPPTTRRLSGDEEPRKYDDNGIPLNWDVFKQQRNDPNLNPHLRADIEEKKRKSKKPATPMPSTSKLTRPMPTPPKLTPPMPPPTSKPANKTKIETQAVSH